MSEISTEDLVLITTGVSITIVVLLAFFFIISIRYFNINRKKQREIFTAVLSAQEIERQRIAHDLHDQVVPMLSAIKLNIGLLKRKNDPELLPTAVKEVQEHLDNSIVDIRRISHNLVPKRITEQGLSGSVESYIVYLQKSESVTVILHHNLVGKTFSEIVETNLYRIIQELINNALKHGMASEINLEMLLFKHEFSIYLADNGKGFNMANRKEGVGTKSIGSRVELFRGKFEWFSKEGEGTRFKAIFNIDYFT